MRCPIVSTPIGCQGIGLIDGEDAFIKNKADEFAQAVLALLDDADLRCRFSTNALNKAKKYFEWNSIIEKFNHLLEAYKK